MNGLVLVFTVLLLVFTISNIDRPEEPCNFIQNSNGKRVSWDSLPVYIYIDSSFPEEYKQSVKSAVNDWNKAYNNELLAVSDNWSNEVILYWSPDWDERNKFQQANTTMYWHSNIFERGEVHVNAKYMIYAKGSVDLESLLVHEFGHVLGLAHNGQDGSVMSPTLHAQEIRRIPSMFDLKSLTCEYNF